MTTTPSPHGAPNPYRREQLIAAVLVGATVILLGFASGLGTTPTSAAAASGGPSSTPMPSMAAPAPTVTVTSTPGIHYVGVPEPGAPTVAPPAVTSTVPTVSSAPSTSTSTAKSSTPPPSSTPASPPPPTSCPSGLLSGLLGVLSVGNILGGGSTSPLSGAGGTLPVNDILGLLLGSLGKQDSALPTLPLSTLTDLVTHLLPSVSGGMGTETASPLVAAACTTSLAGVVPILGGAG